MTTGRIVEAQAEAALSADFVVRAIEPAFMLSLLNSPSIPVVSLNMDVITGTQHQSNRTLFVLGQGNSTAATFRGLSGAACSATFVQRSRGLVQALMLLGATSAASLESVASILAQ